MYSLTLTLSERKAIDWIGNRYAHGDKLYRALWVGNPTAPDDASWDDEREITFSVEEYKAWEIREIGQECKFRWDCFGPELVRKLNEFCEKIV